MVPSIFRSFDSLRTIFRIVSSKSSPPRRWMPSLMTTSFQVPRHFQERGVERASSKVVGYGHRDQPARRSAHARPEQRTCGYLGH